MRRIVATSTEESSFIDADVQKIRPAKRVTLYYCHIDVEVDRKRSHSHGAICKAYPLNPLAMCGALSSYRSMLPSQVSSKSNRPLV